MERQQLIDILQQGTEAWNRWQEQHPDDRDLRGIRLSNVDLSGARFDCVNLEFAHLEDVNLSQATFSYNHRLSRIHLKNCNLNKAWLNNAYLALARFERVSLHEAHLRQADLKEVRLVGTDLSGANLSGANLSGANLFQATLCRANLSGAWLNGANLREADLSGADLTRTSLREADLSKAGFMGADLSEADLSGANLSGAFLLRAHLNQTHLSETNFHEAQIGWTSFGDTDLRYAQGLETVEHMGPSFLSINTLSRSQGALAEAYLQGAGVHEGFLSSVEAIIHHPLISPTCLIGYAQADRDFAEQLCADLRREKIRCWLLPLDKEIAGPPLEAVMKERLYRQTESCFENIKRLYYDKLLLILSEHSVVLFEILWVVRRALMREHQEHRSILVPLRIDKAILENEKAERSLLEMRDTHEIHNFEDWRDDKAYQQTMLRLLHEMKQDKKEGNQENS